jgi:hypothetical protein
MYEDKRFKLILPFSQESIAVHNFLMRFTWRLKHEVLGDTVEHNRTILDYALRYAYRERMVKDAQIVFDQAIWPPSRPDDYGKVFKLRIQPSECVIAFDVKGSLKEPPESLFSFIGEQGVYPFNVLDVGFEIGPAGGEVSLKLEGDTEENRGEGENR